MRVELQETDDRTKMLLTHVGIPSDSPGSMGWNMAFDKLATYVADQVNQWHRNVLCVMNLPFGSRLVVDAAHILRLGHGGI